jgi:hypothetical protein
MFDCLATMLPNVFHKFPLSFHTISQFMKRSCETLCVDCLWILIKPLNLFGNGDLKSEMEFVKHIESESHVRKFHAGPKIFYTTPEYCQFGKYVVLCDFREAIHFKIILVEHFGVKREYVMFFRLST